MSGEEAFGRVRRCVDAEGETWRSADVALLARLATLGREGIGGFSPVTRDRSGAYVRKARAGRTAAMLGKAERWAVPDALGVVERIASALAACEAAGLFPGALSPNQVVIAPEPWLDAHALVAALVGATCAPAPSWKLDAHWTPPAQAAGEAWDAAANRYVLGLVAYRLLAGEHAFEGRGLRDVLAAQARGVTPFDAAVARTMAPGVQAFVLGLLAPDAASRPGSADAIRAACAALRDGSSASMPVTPAARAGAMVAERTSAPRAEAPRAERGIAPSAREVAVLAIGAAALAFLLPRSRRTEATPRVRPIGVLASSSPEACATCHPREVAEWRRSAMAHASRSPLFGALESVVEEQVARDARCPHGAGVLRDEGGDACRDAVTGAPVTGSGGEEWCVRCHAPLQMTRAPLPAWPARSDAASRAPVRDLLSPEGLDGIGCGACHQAIGPVGPHRGGASFEGNPVWTSVASGASYSMRPEDAVGLFGIANSGYRLAPSSFFGATTGAGAPLVHRRATADAEAYVRSSELCGACHDVRLFGTDAIAGPARGEHFKRLRNAYSEWRAWADEEQRRGRTAPTCQGCHMTTYPGRCAPGAAGRDEGCPPGTHFVASAPGGTREGDTNAVSHFFTGVDVPLDEAFDDADGEERVLDQTGTPIGLRARRAMLLRHTFRFELGPARRIGRSLDLPVVIENVGAGHRVPAGFSQEREVWVELTVRDARGRPVYEVGALDGDDEDLRDKRFVRVRVDDALRDGKGRPLGVFGADVADGPDVPEWSPPAGTPGATRFRGRGLVNLQNGFLRCVRCIGVVDSRGVCQALPAQERARAARYEDGAYDIDTGACDSNLAFANAFFETYFPVGALDASRGLLKAPDAIIDTRSAPPGVPLTYVYALDVGEHPAPFRVEARLRFRPFPPYLLRAFAAYEALADARGERPSGAQVTASMMRRNGIVDLAHVAAVIP